MEKKDFDFYLTSMTKKCINIPFTFLETYSLNRNCTVGEHFSLVNGQPIVHTLISLRGPISDTIFRFTEVQDVTNRENVSQAAIYEAQHEDSMA